MVFSDVHNFLGRISYVARVSMVRNPWARMVSMLRYEKSKHFGVHLVDGKLNIDLYKKNYGFPCSLEYDHRYVKKETLPQATEGFGYSNILDEELDFVGRYENLEEDFSFIFKQIGLDHAAAFKKGENPLYDSTNYGKYFTDTTEKEVERMYHYDIMKYNYSFARQ